MGLFGAAAKLVGKGVKAAVGGAKKNIKKPSFTKAGVGEGLRSLSASAAGNMSKEPTSKAGLSGLGDKLKKRREMGHGGFGFGKSKWGTNG